MSVTCLKLFVDPNDSNWGKESSPLRVAMENIQAPDAWNIHTGSGYNGPTVCVIDSGINYNHPDLQVGFASGSPTEVSLDGIGAL